MYIHVCNMCMYVKYVCTCMYVCMYVYMYVCMYIYIYICMYVCMYVCSCNIVDYLYVFLMIAKENEYLVAV